MGHRNARDGQLPEPRVAAGMKELNEMTIGRTDDPENPLRAMAFEAASLFGTGSRTPSGPAVMAPRQQAGHMIAIDPPVRLTFFLHPRGRPHMARRAVLLVSWTGITDDPSPGDTATDLFIAHVTDRLRVTHQEWHPNYRLELLTST